MKILRTVLWVLAAFGFLIFSIYNWQPVELTLWQNLVLETKVPVLALIAFVVGFVPMWALHRSVVWSQNRRIRALETSLKNSAMVRQRETHEPVVPAVDIPVDRSGDKSWSKPGDAADPFGPDPSSGDTDGGGK